MADTFRIDTHHHFCPPEYITQVGKQKRLGRVLTDWTPERSLADMDGGGVATAILSVTTPGLWFGDTGDARQLTRYCNDYAADLVKQHRGRFAFFAATPLPDVDGALAEVSYALDSLGAAGVGLFTSYESTRYLGDPEFVPLFEELNRRSAIVYVHPTVAPCCEGILPELNDSVIEYGTDTTRTIASLVFSGMAGRYPAIRFLFSHGGGTMPFLLWRFESQEKRPEFVAQLPHGALHELKRFYYDTAQAATRPAMLALREVAAPSHIVFGTDYPYQPAAVYPDALRNCGFSDDELRGIDRDNALALFPDLSRSQHAR